MTTYGEEFDEVEGHPNTLVYNFKSTPLVGGRYLSAFTGRKNLALIRQRTKTKSGLKEVTIGFDKEQLEELLTVIPKLLEEIELGRTSDEALKEAQRKGKETIEAMEDGAAKTALKNIFEALKGTERKL
jgi:hypothetical protein